MRIRFGTFLLVITIAVFAIAYWFRPVKQIPTPEPPQDAISHAKSSSGVTSNAGQNISSSTPSFIPPPTGSHPVLSDEARKQKVVAEYNESHNAPIELYALVIDQDNNPLSDVKINVSIPQSLLSAPTPTGDYPMSNNVVRLEQETGADGRIEILGETGSGVDIESIQKDGYELSSKNSRSYGVSSGSLENPVIFKMWKMGEPAQLVSGSKFWGIIPDGRIYTIDLLQGTKVESANAVGDLRMAVSRPAGVSRQDHYDWSFQITPINGGIIESEDDPMYEAPESGYAPEYDFHLNAADTNWTYRVKKDFYIETRDGQNYGRINLEVFAHYQDAGVLNIGWAVNPNRSRNLQP